MPVRYHELETRSGLKDRRRLSAFILDQIAGLRPGLKAVDLDYIFCSDAYLLEKNKAFLNHDTLTDIITFDLSERSDSLQAEIYISIERVEENARIYQVAYNEELHRVIFHGMLHLCGLKDKTAAEQAEMRQAEQQCLSAYGSDASKDKTIRPSA